ncbi:hypothetical protein [Pseudoalteromonas sp. S4741]|uniref:hypothetical protein n=1 Tax=Pseudoalteromonas sp. S4741 TaxID=579563 RepID=UPI00110B900A|nr:hypothetical protein [Pseudoalteromonas sp. S4741]TMO21671.1 hypothetical protein CWC30_13595 [Pseudoalteromonas sp. S4741]
MIRIHEVKKESQADTLGLLSGDVIYEVNNTKIAEPYDFLSELLKAVVFRNLCHFSNIKKTGVTHDSIFRLQQSIS